MELLFGDCLELMPEIEDNSIDLLFCDLPWNATHCNWDCLINLDELWKQFNRICKEDTPMIFMCSVKFGNTLINSNTKYFRYELIWEKTRATGHLNSKKLPLKSHEMIYIFYRKLSKVYTENIELNHKYKFIKNNNKSLHETKTDEVYNITNHNPYELTPKEKSSTVYNPPLPNSILKFKSESSKHSTQKPVTLMEWILKYYSRPNGVVLDPTCGSGSMGVACKNMKRKFIGIEKEISIFEVAMERLHIKE